MAARRVKTGGTWDPSQRNVSFLAGEPHILAIEGVELHPYLLVALNHIEDRHIDMIEGWCRAGTHVLIDSGVFSLASSHARTHGLTHDQALNLAPHDVDGFDRLLERYVALIERVGNLAWGYIEIDLGGKDNKIKTRGLLESMGLHPIPVYHPLADGWDYFDDLARQYDRLCFGNVVQASHIERNKLLATAYTRRQAYPDLWIHVLGMTANEYLNAYPIDSCDSSTWLAHIRWPAGVTFRSALKGTTRMSTDMRYLIGADKSHPAFHDKGVQLGSFDAFCNDRCWRGLRDEYRAAVGVS